MRSKTTLLATADIRIETTLLPTTDIRIIITLLTAAHIRVEITARMHKACHGLIPVELVGTHHVHLTATITIVSKSML